MVYAWDTAGVLVVYAWDTAGILVVCAWDTAEVLVRYASGSSASRPVSVGVETYQTMCWSSVSSLLDNKQPTSSVLCFEEA